MMDAHQYHKIILNRSVGPVGIEPTTEGLWGGSKPSDWSGGVG